MIYLIVLSTTTKNCTPVNSEGRTGVLLLLNNYLIIDLNVLEFWLIIFILFGLQLILQGDR